MPDRTPRPIDKRVPRARALRRDPTEAEKKLWLHLRDIFPGKSHFRRQATIGPYFADFACHQTKIVIEVDGGQHADSQSDTRRTEYLESRGYRVLRFWNNDVLSNIEGVLESICSNIGVDGSPPPPTPPRRRRGEGRSAVSRVSSASGREEK
jgi:very-short-patch-repair endonuclease